MSFTEQAELQFANCMKQARGADKAFRQEAWAEYQRQGLPGRKNEAWKYSSIAALSGKAWAAAAASDEIPATALRLIQEWRGQFDIAVMINGSLNKKASLMTLESGYEFLSLPREESLPAIQYEDGFVPLAAALNRGGYELRVAPGMSIAKPLLIMHCAQGEGSWVPTLNRIHVGRAAELHLAEVYVGPAAAYLRTDITHAEVFEGANLNWIRLQEDSPKASHFSEVQARLKHSAKLSLAQVNGGGGWARGSLKVDIEGEGAEAQVNGLSFGRDEQHIDQRVQLNHHAANSSSSQVFKGVLKDRARGILNGKIFIAPHAQKVNSSQINHNLLLSSTAEADTKPELEIYADDVKANHGASVGKMDEDKLFYLMSRAIPRAEAVQMLAHAFVGDVIMKTPAGLLRELLAFEVEALLPEFLSQMETVK
jgi:Fe-S cluster assembly protein SufD